MIWQNPWAWWGLLTIALPILIHLVGRHRPRLQRFPTLRFLELAAPPVSRRQRITDLPLLLVRVAILIAAVAGLSQPFLNTPDRDRRRARSLARAIIIDTSASMRRATPAGPSARAAARDSARRLGAQAATSVVLESAEPAQALAGAAEWLRRQPGRAELVVISDFQAGSIARTDLGAIPRELGVRLARIEVVSDSAPLELRGRQGDEEIRARFTRTDESTTVQWTSSNRIGDRGSRIRERHGITLLAGTAEGERAAAALEAALSLGVPVRTDSLLLPVVIVYPGYEQRADLWRGAASLSEAGQGALVARIGADSTIERTAAVTLNGRAQLALFTRAEPGSLASAQLILAVLRALITPIPVSELESAVLPLSLIESWQRAPGSDRAPHGPRDNAPSDGRWLWLIALALIGLESWLRRGRKKVEAAARAQEGDRLERVA